MEVRGRQSRPVKQGGITEGQQELFSIFKRQRVIKRE